MATDSYRTHGTDLSVCAPVYNEDALVEEFYARRPRRSTGSTTS